MLRLDEVVPAETFTAGSVQPRWLHIDDAVAAIVRAATVERLDEQPARWMPVNIARGGQGSRFPTGTTAAALGFAPVHHGAPSGSATLDAPAFPSPPTPVESLPEPARILILGAGGPVGAAATEALKPDHRLRLADRRSMAEVAAAPPQSEGAPLPSPVEPPHEERSVDVTDAAAVRDAARDMDAIINLTVVRPDPVEAFRVNTLGAWNVMRAAVHHGIRRVVHTGPILTLGKHPSGYVEDRDVASNVPPRPGDNLYFVSKFLGQEICRIFAEQHGIAVPALLFYNFVNPEVVQRQGQLPGPGNITWNDSGRALAAAVRVPRMPEPFVVAHILADAPHDRYRNDTARRLLGWEPMDRLDALWYRHGV
ncbi:MAG TPA: NAD-dependent epimerase/dehydratase family protein [Thermomicrobiales bacterium]|nr:NAD-dependent epimerase/dehydratase family protein [Thermomicrobiales bacterium]